MLTEEYMKEVDKGLQWYKENSIYVKEAWLHQVAVKLSAEVKELQAMVRLYESAHPRVPDDSREL